MNPMVPDVRNSNIELELPQTGNRAWILRHFLDNASVSQLSQITFSKNNASCLRETRASILQNARLHKVLDDCFGVEYKIYNWRLLQLNGKDFIRPFSDRRRSSANPTPCYLPPPFIAHLFITIEKGVRFGIPHNDTPQNTQLKTGDALLLTGDGPWLGKEPFQKETRFIWMTICPIFVDAGANWLEKPLNDSRGAPSSENELIYGRDLGRAKVKSSKEVLI